MALRGRRIVKLDDENTITHGMRKEVTVKRTVLGIKKDDGIKKDVTIKRGALGEISNRAPGLSIRGVNAITKKSSLKDVQAKVDTRHVVKPKAVTRKASSVTLGTVVEGRSLPKVELKEPEVVLKKPEVVLKEPEVVQPEPAYSAELLNVEPIDTDDDPIQVSVYARDIYKYLHEQEIKFPIRPEYLTGQSISRRMRSVLIDWLIEVHQQFHLLQETLYLTVAIIDRFLQDFRTVDRKTLQLVGVSALSLACKYEEMYAPDIGDYVYISDNSYTKEQILKMEGTILTQLQFSFGRPLPLHFLRRYSKAAKAVAEVHVLAKYFLELSLLEYKMCHLPPSIVAAAAVYLALLLFSKDKNAVWTDTLAYHSTYALADIAPVVRQLATVIVDSPTATQQATRTKYASSKQLSISRRPEILSQILIDIVSGTDDLEL